MPFSSVAELIFLELAFELIREAGVRIPGSLGSTIGIVGGLIVDRRQSPPNLVSPIVVMIVALTALGGMALPNEEFASAFRLLKYLFLFLGGYLGIFGIVLGIYMTVAHLAGLLSFGMPYLMPFVKKEDGGGTGEGILRLPFRKRIKTSCLRQTGRKAKAEKEGRALKFAEKQQNFPQTALPSDDPCLPCAFSFSVCREKKDFWENQALQEFFWRWLFWLSMSFCFCVWYRGIRTW